MSDQERSGLSAPEPRYTRDELVEELGLSPEYAEKIWNAFGFARQSTPDKIFTAEEVKALGLFADSEHTMPCLLYTSPSPRDRQKSRMPSSA